jgi:hypothetical protein
MQRLRGRSRQAMQDREIWERQETHHEDVATQALTGPHLPRQRAHPFTTSAGLAGRGGSHQCKRQGPAARSEKRAGWVKPCPDAARSRQKGHHDISAAVDKKSWQVLLLELTRLAED